MPITVNDTSVSLLSPLWSFHFGVICSSSQSQGSWLTFLTWLTVPSLISFLISVVFQWGLFFSSLPFLEKLFLFLTRTRYCSFQWCFSAVCWGNTSSQWSQGGPTSGSRVNLTVPHRIPVVHGGCHVFIALSSVKLRCESELLRPFLWVLWQIPTEPLQLLSSPACSSPHLSSYRMYSG